MQLLHHYITFQITMKGARKQTIFGVNMTNAIIASLYHVSDYHERCPKTNDIWCQFQKDKIDGTDFTKINMVYP